MTKLGMPSQTADGPLRDDPLAHLEQLNGKNITVIVYPVHTALHIGTKPLKKYITTAFALFLIIAARAQYLRMT